MGMGEVGQGQENAAANLRSKLLFNPISIWMAHCILSYTIGQVVLANFIDGQLSL
jgi:hypothetical protein